MYTSAAASTAVARNTKISNMCAPVHSHISEAYHSGYDWAANTPVLDVREGSRLERVQLKFTLLIADMPSVGISTPRGACKRPAGGHFPAYFSIHFNSSRTLILPCQGCFESPCSSPCKTSRVVGMPRLWSARSRR